jgi:hypothetical protein
MASITSANAVLTLSIGALYASPQQITNFATDDIFDVDPLQAAEAMMGVDGKLSAGLVFAEVQMKLALMADSPSIAIFENWYQTQRKVGDVYVAQAEITLSSVNRSFALTNGYLTTYPPVSSAKKVLQPRVFGLTWESIVPSRLGAGN